MVFQWQYLRCLEVSLWVYLWLSHFSFNEYCYRQYFQDLYDEVQLSIITIYQTMVCFWHCWLPVRDRKGSQPVKSWALLLVCWWWQFDWSFARLIAPVVTTTSITRAPNPGLPGKMAVKTERGVFFVNVFYILYMYSSISKLCTII